MITLKSNIPGVYACNSLFITSYFVVLTQQVNYCCLRQTLEKKWEYNEAVLRLVINFKKACDSVMMGLLYNIFTEFGIPMKVL